MNYSSNRTRSISLLLATVTFVLISCGLNQDDKIDQTISFNSIYDSLALFDSVQISLKDTSGHTLDNIYHGKVDTISEIMNLPARNWTGGVVRVVVLGYKDGELVYHMERTFDGSTDKSLDTTYVVLPNTNVSADDLDIRLYEGDSVSFPSLIVSPLNLKDKSLSWASSQPKVLSVTSTGLIALKRGEALLTASLVSNPTKSVTFNVTIGLNPNLPESLWISPETLSLAAGGASASVTIKVKPLTSNPAVRWGVLDSGIARVGTDGVVKGLKPGETRLWAVSVKKTTISDTILVSVSGPVPVEWVVFPKDSVNLFIGGAPESLWVDVLPPKSNPEVEFRILNPGVVSLTDGKVLALAPGTAYVIAQSTENPGKTDTLKLNAYLAQKIDGVTVSPDSLKLYTGGASTTLTGTVSPKAAYQGLSWRSLNPAVAVVDADGKVTPVGPGRTSILAQSRADTTQKALTPVVVKRDMPQVFVGRDTVISPGNTLSFRPLVVQEYGKVVEFKWDLNGDGIWEGAADSLKTVSFLYDSPKDYTASFYVKDTEGNDTTVAKRIKVVSGKIVLIQSPMNNTYTNQTSIKVKWTIDGVVQDSSPTALKDGPNVITRTTTDSAGTSYSGTVTVYLDTIPPHKPQVHALSVTSSVTPSWTWASGGNGGYGLYRVGIDGEPLSSTTEFKDTVYSPTKSLTEGPHTLFVQERDVAGNWSESGSASITIDVTPPSAPVVSGTASPTSNPRPAWSWTSGGGNGNYEIKLDNAVVAPTSNLSYSPSADLPEGNHTLTVREADAAMNWSATGSLTIFVDKNNPLLTIDGANPRISSTTTISISGTVADGSGSGVKAVSISGSISGGGAATIVGGAWSKTGLVVANGPNSITATATDNVGRISNASITVNVSIPIASVTITSPAMGFVTNAGSVQIKYKVDNGAEQSVTKTLVEGSNSFDITSPPNEVGKTSKATTSIYRRENVIFVRENGAGKKDGSSWEDAIGDLGLAVATFANEGKEIWVASGTYAGFHGYSNINLLGGFDAESHQNNSTTRGKSTVGNIVLHGIFDADLGSSNKSIVDGFSFSGYVAVPGADLTMNSCQFAQSATSGGISVTSMGSATLNNLQINGVTFSGPAIYIEDARFVTINGGVFTNNTVNESLFKMVSGYLVLGGTVSISGNTFNNPPVGFGPATIWEVDGVVEVNDPVTLQTGADLYWESGRYTYHGNRIH